MTIDFHTHTYHSYDSLMRPEKILKLAKQRGLNAIVINDHDTIKGGLECAQINKDKDFKVIVGAEIKTDVGDITGIFLKEEISSRHYADVIKEIKNQGGITILNHPFVGHKLDDMNFDGIDLIEGYNGRLSKTENELAVQLAQKLGKPIIAGSDSHIYSEISNCKTHYLDFNNLMNPSSVDYTQCSILAPVISQIIKANKKGDAGLMISVILSIPGKIFRRTFK